MSSYHVCINHWYDSRLKVAEGGGGNGEWWRGYACARVPRVEGGAVCWATLPWGAERQPLLLCAPKGCLRRPDVLQSYQVVQPPPILAPPGGAVPLLAGGLLALTGTAAAVRSALARRSKAAG